MWLHVLNRWIGGFGGTPLLQGKRVTQETMATFIKETCSDMPEEDRQRLLALTPETYTGNAEAQARRILAMIGRKD